MKRIDPVGREWREETGADYSVLRTGCKCSKTSVYATSSRGQLSCACHDGDGTVGTRVRAS
ncbi:MAG: hypothetical protein J6A03_08005 [Lachnospiraceae bacterium]|nr:hypothetical protein [Lachnospiraceae bacterium]